MVLARLILMLWIVGSSPRTNGFRAYGKAPGITNKALSTPNKFKT